MICHIVHFLDGVAVVFQRHMMRYAKFTALGCIVSSYICVQMHILGLPHTQMDCFTVAFVPLPLLALSYTLPLIS